MSAPPATATADGALNAGQKRALERVLAGESVFITGAAGTGKTFLLRRIIDALAARFGATENDGTVPVTAPTGIAASHLGGQTIHSWAGIGLGKGSVDKLLPKVLSNDAAVGRWRRASALVIDEVSMLDGSLHGARGDRSSGARCLCAVRRAAARALRRFLPAPARLSRVRRVRFRVGRVVVVPRHHPRADGNFRCLGLQICAEIPTRRGWWMCQPACRPYRKTKIPLNVQFSGAQNWTFIGILRFQFYARTQVA